MIDSLFQKKDFNCCGCLACLNVCPNNAIEITYSEKGFYIPKINKEKCINCGKCLKACPSLKFEPRNKKLDAGPLKEFDINDTNIFYFTSIM